MNPSHPDSAQERMCRKIMDGLVILAFIGAALIMTEFEKMKRGKQRVKSDREFVINPIINTGN